MDGLGVKKSYTCLRGRKIKSYGFNFGCLNRNSVRFFLGEIFFFQTKKLIGFPLLVVLINYTLYDVMGSTFF